MYLPGKLFHSCNSVQWMYSQTYTISEDCFVSPKSMLNNSAHYKLQPYGKRSKEQVNATFQHISWLEHFGCMLGERWEHVWTMVEEC